MSREGSDFDAVLKEAQELGYAERNPEADVEGHDACRKIAILSSLAYGSMWIMRKFIQKELPKLRGGYGVCKCLGMNIKLLATSKKM